jgi:hypothetical protein
MAQPVSQGELNNRFDYHPPRTNEVAAAHEEIREASRHFAETLLQLTYSSREQSLALTKIEEAMFWANAAIARNQ